MITHRAKSCGLCCSSSFATAIGTSQAHWQVNSANRYSIEPPWQRHLWHSCGMLSLCQTTRLVMHSSQTGRTASSYEAISLLSLPSAHVFHRIAACPPNSISPRERLTAQDAAFGSDLVRAGLCRGAGKHHQQLRNFDYHCRYGENVVKFADSRSLAADGSPKPHTCVHHICGKPSNRESQELFMLRIPCVSTC